MTDDQPNKPPSLPESGEKPDGTPDDLPEGAGYAPPEVRPEQADEPPKTEEDTEPSEASDTQPKRPALIPAPPGGKPSGGTPVVRRRRGRRRKGSLWAALGIAALLSVIIVLVFAVLVVSFAPAEYVDPWIPGRLATRTEEAQIVAATDDAVATRDAAFAAAATGAARDVAATGTAVVERENSRATQDALNLAGTAVAIEGTATAGALSFDATRTAVALQAQNAAAASTLETLRLQFTQTAIADSARATAVRATVGASSTANASARFAPTAPPVALESGAAPLPTAAGGGTNTFFADNFDSDLRAGWVRQGAWRTTNGRALSNVCGSTLLVGTDRWDDYAVEVDVDSPGAQYAVSVGYGDGGRLYVNFGLGGALWWLAEGTELIDTNIMNDAFDPARTNRVRLEARGRVAAVYVNGFLVAERLLPQRTGGPAGLYTCPANAIVPTFDNFRVVGLADD